MIILNYGKKKVKLKEITIGFFNHKIGGELQYKKVNTKNFNYITNESFYYEIDSIKLGNNFYTIDSYNCYEYIEKLSKDIDIFIS